MYSLRIPALVIFFLSTSLLLTIDSPKGQAPFQKPDQSKPLTPKDELKTFQLDPNFTIELVAAEPEVVDPVAFCFDAKENLYVVEMRGYPNAGTGEGNPNLTGRIKKLEDRDGDGYYETSTVFLDNLRFPCAITPWRNGFLIGDAPDLLYAEDSNGTGKANIKRVLYTGFGPKNIQQMINGLQFHFDNWVYGCNGGNDSPVHSVEKPESPVTQLRGMHFRFKPDAPGSLEPTSGGGQYGMAVTESGDWLTCTNSQHIRHIVLPDHYLKRNPYLAVPAVTLDIADHGAACKVFRISPFETWRVERTMRRAGSEDAKRFPATELVPGGYVTSGCGIAVWNADVAPKEYRGNAFVCDPANNLIHRDVLVKQGSTFRAERHDQDCEFLASTDTWFRPVFLANGPGGAFYFADFYREIIETPLSLPDDIKARWNLNSRERGRIWRIGPKGQTKSERRPKPAEMNDHALVKIAMNNHADEWSVNTAQRLLLERRVSDEIRNEVKQYASLSAWEVHDLGEVRIRALWLMQAWNMLQPEQVQNALQSFNPSLRKQGVILAEYLPAFSSTLKDNILRLVEDSDPHVRLQLAFTLGSLPLTQAEKAGALVKLAAHPEADSWLLTAVLSSLSQVELITLRLAYFDRRIPAQFLERIAAVASRAFAIEQLLQDGFLKKLKSENISDRHVAVLQGLGASFVRQQPGLGPKLLETVSKQQTEKQKLKTIPVLALVPFSDAEPILRSLLQSQQPPAIQQAALQALAQHSDQHVAEIILENWLSWSPPMRREAQEVLFSRTSHLTDLLTAAEQGKFALNQLEPARRDQLLHHGKTKLRERAKQLLAAQTTTSRSEIIKKYQSSLTLLGDVTRGKQLFLKNCSTCHQFDGQGHAVAPDLNSALGNKTKDALLIDILDPNREVDSRYVNYVITTKQGRTLTGVISTESASSITLCRAEGVEETCLRADIDEIQGTGKSLMPENLEEQLTQQELADVMTYLLSTRSRK